MMADILKPPPKAQILNIVQPKMGWTLPKLHYGRIHLVHLRSLKYFTDDSSVNFHDKFCLHFVVNFSKKWRKNLSWKFTDESSIKYLRVCKWTRWIWPKTEFQTFVNIFFFALTCQTSKKPNLNMFELDPTLVKTFSSWPHIKRMTLVTPKDRDFALWKTRQTPRWLFMTTLKM